MNAPLGGVGGRTSRYTIGYAHASDLGNIEAGSILINESESAVIYLGDTSVSPMTGIALTPGNTCTWQKTCPAYAITDAASGILVVSNFVSDIDRAVRDSGSLIDLLAERVYTDEYTSSLTVDVSAYPSVMVEAITEAGDDMTVTVSFLDPETGAEDEFSVSGESVSRYYPVSGKTLVVARSGSLDDPETIRVWGMQQYVGPSVRPTSDVYPNNIVPLGTQTVTSTAADEYSVQFDPREYASILVSFQTNDTGMSTDPYVQFLTPSGDQTSITLAGSSTKTGTIQVNTVGENLLVDWTASASGKVFNIAAWGIKAIKPGGGGGGTQDVNIVSPDPVNVNIASPDPMSVSLASTVDVNIVSPNPLVVSQEIATGESATIELAIAGSSKIDSTTLSSASVFGSDKLRIGGCLMLGSSSFTGQAVIVLQNNTVKCRQLLWTVTSDDIIISAVDYYIFLPYIETFAFSEITSSSVSVAMYQTTGQSTASTLKLFVSKPLP